MTLIELNRMIESRYMKKDRDFVYEDFINNKDNWIQLNTLECCPVENPKNSIDFSKLQPTYWINKNQSSRFYGFIVNTRTKEETVGDEDRIVFQKNKSISKKLIIKSLEYTLADIKDSYNIYRAGKIHEGNKLSDCSNVIQQEYLKARDILGTRMFWDICKDRSDIEFVNDNNMTSLDEVSTTRSKQQYLWVCHKCGYIYQTSAYNRVRAVDSCPMCKSNHGKGTSIPEKIVQHYVKQCLGNNHNISCNDRRQLLNPNTKKYLELDVYIPDIHKAIEYDTNYTHRIEERDINKNTLAAGKKIELYRIYGTNDKSYFHRDIKPEVLNDSCKRYTYYINSDDDFVKAMDICFKEAFNVQCDFSDFKQIKRQLIDELRK